VKSAAMHHPDGPFVRCLDNMRGSGPKAHVLAIKLAEDANDGARETGDSYPSDDVTLRVGIGAMVFTKVAVPVATYLGIVGLT
jgi:hypothetical protein